ncbi:MAG: RNA-binding protein [Opitutales bacterium]|nr:RNA-binding protein [Opitutales bacterium]
MDIYVGNLPFKTSEDALRDAFAQHGTVGNVKIISDFETGRSKGFAFVTMDDADEANNAIEALDGADFEGRPLKVNQARERTERRPGGGGGGGGGFRPRNGGGGGGGGGRRDRY